MAGDFDSSLPVRTVSVEELQVQTKAGTHLASNLTQIVGTTVSVNTGTMDAGTQRVAIASDNTLTVGNITGTVSLPTGAATLAEQQTQTTSLQLIDNLPLALGSTTSGSNGALSLGAVTTAAPTYTTATNNALSLTTAGDLRTASKMLDGSGNALSSTTGSLNVNITGGSSAGTEFAEDAAHASGDLGTLSLGVRQDTLATSTSADGDYAALKVNSDGALYTSLTNTSLAVTQSGTWNINNITGTVSLPTGAATLAEQQTQTTSLQLIDNLPLTQGSTTSGQSGLLAQGAVTTAAPTYTTGNTNPLSLTTAGALRVAVVSTVSTAADATNVFNQNTSADIATNGTNTHTYTPGANFYLTDVIASASGKFKVEIRTGVTASEVVRVVLFTQSERQAVWHLPEPLLVATTDSVVIIRTNLDNQVQPLYSTVQGYLA